MNDLQVIEQESNSVVTQATGMMIKNNEQRAIAIDFLKVIKGMQKKVAEAFDPIIEKAHQAHKEALAQKDKYYKPLVQAEKNLRQKDVDFVAEQERIRQEQEAKLRREAEEKQRELDRKAEEARAAGKEKLADKYEDKSAAIVAPILAPRTEDIAGVSYREVWDFEIVSEDLIPREYMTPDLSAIGKVVRAMKNALPIPGVRIFSKKVSAINTK